MEHENHRIVDAEILLGRKYGISGRQRADTGLAPSYPTCRLELTCRGKAGLQEREHPQGWPGGVQYCGKQVSTCRLDQLRLQSRIHPLYWHPHAVREDCCANHLTAGGLTMDIKPIKTDADYREAIKEVESLMMAGPDTPEGEKLDIMVTLIEAYEAKHFPMDLPDPVEAIKFEMERRDLTVKDLEPMIGKSNRVYEILNHKRSLTLKMIWKLHEGLGIPAESLIKPPKAHA